MSVTDLRSNRLRQGAAMQTRVVEGKATAQEMTELAKKQLRKKMRE